MLGHGNAINTWPGCCSVRGHFFQESRLLDLLFTDTMLILLCIVVFYSILHNVSCGIVWA